MAETPKRAGLLLIRIWEDSPSPGGLRARVIRTPDVEEEPTESVVGSVAEINELVRAWLEDFFRGAPSVTPR